MSKPKDQMSAAEFRQLFVNPRPAAESKKIASALMQPPKKKNEVTFTELGYKKPNRIYIKPLSVNEVWKGKRFKTDSYKHYENLLIAQLPPITLPPPPYQINFKFGFSSASSDWDNPVKPLQDVLQKKYKFNDKLIKRAIVDIENVEKGNEFIEFKIETLK